MKRAVNRNGSYVDYTVKELLRELNDKVDSGFAELTRRMQKVDEATTSLKIWRLAHSLMIGALFTLMCYILIR